MSSWGHRADAPVEEDKTVTGILINNLVIPAVWRVQLER